MSQLKDKIKLLGSSHRRDSELVVEKVTDYKVPLMIARVAVYAFLIGVFLVGAWNLVRNDRADLEKLKADVEVKLYGEKAFYDSEAARGMAERFTRLYIEYTASPDQEKRDQLSDMVDGGASVLGITKADANVNLSVKDVYTWDAEKVSDSQMNVTTCAEVEITKSSAAADGTITTEKINKDVYLMVPLFYEGGAFLVDSAPVFVPSPANAVLSKNESVTLNETERSSRDEIKETLQAFFKAYYEGSLIEISYYLENERQMTGLNGAVTFDQLASCQTYWIDESAGKALALAKIVVTDPDTTSKYAQWYHIELLKADERWYITKMDTRITNLKQYIIEEEAQ